MVSSGATSSSGPRSALPSDALGSYAADPASTMRPPPPSDARNRLEAAGLCRRARMGTGVATAVAHHPPIGQGIRRRLIPIEFVCQAR